MAIGNECIANLLPAKVPGLLNMWFCGSEANFRELFDKALAASPCILFSDEMESIAHARRGGGAGGSYDTSGRVIIQFCPKLSSALTLFIIDTTNQCDIIPFPGHSSRVSISKSIFARAVKTMISRWYNLPMWQKASPVLVTEICQRAAKNAMRDRIAAGIERQRQVEVWRAYTGRSRCHSGLNHHHVTK